MSDMREKVREMLCNIVEITEEDGDGIQAYKIKVDETLDRILALVEQDRAEMVKKVAGLKKGLENSSEGFKMGYKRALTDVANAYLSRELIEKPQAEIDLLKRYREALEKILIDLDLGAEGMANIARIALDKEETDENNNRNY